MAYHRPVLLSESIAGLNLNPHGTYVDVTFGGGGHSNEILRHLSTGRLIAFDQDPDAEANVIRDERFTLVRQNFRFLTNYLKLYKAIPIDGLLADLGVSSHQFDSANRGFTIREDAHLDMRMDQKGKLTAREVVNTYDEAQLIQLLRLYGELKNARPIAWAIAKAREDKAIETVFELKNAVSTAMRGADKRKENQFYARIFQALRIEVNGELDALRSLLEQCADVVGKGGRIAFISYHSLEDRLVKQFMRTGRFEGEVEKDLYGNPLRPFNPINSKVIIPSDEEIELNPRARSAKLRIAERNG